MQDRLEILESKLAYLELTIEELNHAVYAQSKQLVKAQKLITSLQEKIGEMVEDSQAEPFSVEDERPPHY